MSRSHGITSSTPDRFYIDAGAVYKNWGEVNEALIGATRGGNSFKIETEQREMPMDGARGVVKGAKRNVTVAATLTANFLEMTTPLLLLTQPGATAADYPDTPSKTHDLITRSADIADADYITNIVIVGDNTQSPTNKIVVMLENVLADGNLEVGFNDKDESVVAVNFAAHFLPSDLDTEPWKVYNPIIA